MDNVKSELVIVDTGSTDRTIEIARQYTSKVYNFEWINDFAAERNFGLKKCRGQWFMFLDADEHFGDVSEMISFFNNESVSGKYNYAVYEIRNIFILDEPEHYTVFYNIRIARRTDNLIFEGTIHELLVGYYEPSYWFNTYVNHYGYEQSVRVSKKRRNLPLIEEEMI